MSEQLQTYLQFFFTFVFVGVVIYGAYKFYQVDKKYGWHDEIKTK